MFIRMNIFNKSEPIYDIRTLETMSQSANKIVDVLADVYKKDGDFFKIFQSKRSDKVTHHGYYYFYPRFLEHYRKMDMDGCGGGGAMLEFGIENKHSFNAWLDYFPRAFFYGIDIQVNEESSQRFELLRLDQSHEESMKMVATKITLPLFFVIDDGSHIPEHQILCFNIFFEKMARGGTYIIEDIETSYWSKEGLYGYKTEYGFHHPKSIVEIFKNIADDINGEFLHTENKQKQNEIYNNIISENNRKDISTITFGQNCIIITKKTQDEKQLFDKPYVWERCL